MDPFGSGLQQSPALDHSANFPYSKMVGMDGLEPSEAVRPTHLQCVAIAAMRHTHRKFLEMQVAANHAGVEPT